MVSQDVIGTLAVMLGTGLACQALAGILPVPRMLVLLVAGTLLGPSVAGVLDVPLGSTGAQLLLTLGVSFILFHGGLHLSARVLQPVAVGIGLLAVPGVVLTAAITGVVAGAAFHLPLASGFLVGAVLAPTDPAILIPLFERMGVRRKVSQAVIAESAINDPTGAVLALTLVGVVLSRRVSLAGPAEEFVVDLAVSTALGITFGVVLAAAVSSRRAGIWRESAAIAVMAVVSGGYFSIGEAGGSGYLGAFLAGFIVGNMDRLGLAMHGHHERELRTLVAVVADVMVMFVFITLGANLPWGDMAADLAPALAVVAALVFVARPLAVLACLLPDRRGRWTRQELLFLAWTRETGVVPAALAGIVVAEGVPRGEVVVTTVAVAAVLTLGLQSTSKRWLARRLGLIPPPARGRDAAGEPTAAGLPGA